tara:strand:- start:694 stop:3180 length:2487 start_codon:yes stop_codon:yes gene_type:complete
MNISDRVFGSDFSPEIKKKLLARQAITENAKANESILSDIGKHNFNGEAELSSRKVWARMWTAVSVYRVENAGSENQVASDPLEVKVYAVGNNNLSDYEQNNTSANESIMADFLSNNDYMKPNAGITNISSELTGYLGTIKNTTVNFKVFNYFDYDNIVTNYFLKPGATVFVDWGWDTSLAYDPLEEFKKNSSLSNIEEFLYGSPTNPNGLVQKSKGDLEVVFGYVTKYDAKANSDGSFDCTITITSKNYAIIDHDQSGLVKLDNLFKNTITDLALKRLAEEMGLAEIYDLDWIISSKKGGQWRKAVAKSVASTETKLSHQTTGFKYPVIPEASYKSGIYFQYLDDDVGDKKKKIPDLNNNMYVTIKFFEDEFMNNTLGIKMDNSDNDVGFNSEGQYVKFNENLYKKQLYTKNKSSLHFLYPDRDIDKVKSSGSVPIRDLFIKVSLINSEFSINTDIKVALKNILDKISGDSLDVMKLKLMSINNGNGFSIVDINNPLILSDIKNRYDLGERKKEASKEKNFDDLFMFKPYSPNSMVSSIDLTLTTPNSGLANMIAIQSLGGDKKTFPISENILNNLALKSLNIDGDIHYEHLPTVDKSENRVEKQQKNEVIIPSQVTMEIEGEDNDSEILNTIDKFYQGGSAESVDFVKKLNEDYNYAVSASSAVKVSKSEKDQFSDEVADDTVVTTSPSRYFEHKVRKHMVTGGNYTPILPYSLSFSIYGISGISPGNSFRVDYLPKLQREKSFFCITKVTHDISTSTWTTKIDAQMRMRSDKPLTESHIISTPPIKLSKKALKGMGYSKEQITDIWENNLNWEEIPPDPPEVKTA